MNSLWCIRHRAGVWATMSNERQRCQSTTSQQIIPLHPNKYPHPEHPVKLSFSESDSVHAHPCVSEKRRKLPRPIICFIYILEIFFYHYGPRFSTEISVHEWKRKVSVLHLQCCSLKPWTKCQISYKKFLFVTCPRLYRNLTQDYSDTLENFESSWLPWAALWLTLLPLSLWVLG